MFVAKCIASFFLLQTLGSTVSAQESTSEVSAAIVATSVEFYMYNSDNLEGSEVTLDDESLLTASKFDPTKKTKVVIHGFLDSQISPAEREIVEAYLGNQDVNVLAVDWSKLADGLYTSAVSNTLPVGKEVALMIDYLVSTGGANVSDFHIVGHSLGAHIAGFAANYVTSGRITRVTGLDPALPLFALKPESERLNSDDADLVDCIHTSGGYLGFWRAICTIDFYPNGGSKQPGCGLDLLNECGHGRAYELFASSISYSFPAQSCDSLTEVETGTCTGDWTGYMGESAPSTSPDGIYYLTTTGTYPYTS